MTDASPLGYAALCMDLSMRLCTYVDDNHLNILCVIVANEVRYANSIWLPLVAISAIAIELRAWRAGFEFLNRFFYCHVSVC